MTSTKFSNLPAGQAGKSQVPKLKHQTVWDFGHWLLELIWVLFFRIWNFISHRDKTESIPKESESFQLMPEFNE